MLKMIVAGGQTGADRAALDVAIRLNIPHGGWVPKGRLAEDGRIPQKYRLNEMPTASLAARTKQNVLDSDGTLIIARGKLTGGSDYTRKMTLMHKKQLLGIDLDLTSHYDAASLVVSWISLQRIEVLNVAGPRASEDPAIYHDVQQILERAIQALKNIDSNVNPGLGQFEFTSPPTTVEEAVDKLIFQMSFKDKTALANLAPDDLVKLRFSLGISIRNLLLYPRNEQLLESCRQEAMDKYLHWDQAPAVIIKKLWQKLSETHRLRVVK